MTFDETLGEQVRNCRIMRGYTQRELATIIGISAQQMQKYESGKNRMSVLRLHQLAQALSVSLYILLMNNEDTAHFMHPEIQKNDRLLFSLLQAYRKIARSEHRQLLYELANALTGEVSAPQQEV